jgi:hypothetical protein
VDRIIYHSVTPCGVAASSEGDLWGRTRWLSQRLLDPKDNLSFLVREITIVKWANLEESYTEGDVTAMDAAPQNLQTFEQVLPPPPTKKPSWHYANKEQLE